MSNWIPGSWMELAKQAKAIGDVVGVVFSMERQVSGYFQRRRERRIEILNKECSVSFLKVLPTLADNPDFLEALRACLRAIDETTREEKVKWYARLLINGATNPPQGIAFDFAYYQRILDELSVQELGVLHIINEHQKKKLPATNVTSFIHDNWDGSIGPDLMKTYVLNNEQLEAILLRLQGKGLLIRPRGNTGDPGRGGRGFVSPLFEELDRLCRFKADEMLSGNP